MRAISQFSIIDSPKVTDNFIHSRQKKRATKPSGSLYCTRFPEVSCMFSTT